MATQTEHSNDGVFFDNDVVDNACYVKNAIGTAIEGVGQPSESTVESINLLLDLILPPDYSPTQDVYSEELDLGIVELMRLFGATPSILSESKAFVLRARESVTTLGAKFAMDNRLDVLQFMDKSDEGALTAECRAAITHLYTIILPPTDPDIEINKSLIENLTVAIQCLEEVEDGLSITNECKQAIRKLLTLISPPSATHIKDTCSVCYSDEYGTYHRTGFKCLRCYGVRDMQEEAGHEGSACRTEEMSRLALNRHLSLQPDKEEVDQYKSVVRSMESIDTPIFVDSVTKAQQSLPCNDSARYDQQGFDYSDLEHEAAATLGVLEGRFTKKFDMASKSVMIGSIANLLSDGGGDLGLGHLREPTAPGQLPGKYLSTRTEGFHFSLNESFRTVVRTLAHPNLLYLFSMAVGSRPVSDGTTENDCVWYIHENLPMLVEHLEEDASFMNICNGADVGGSPTISLRLCRQPAGASNGQHTLGSSANGGFDASDACASSFNQSPLANSSESIEELKAVMFSIFSATNALHERGIAHGDLRPHNLFRDPINSIIKVRFAPNYTRLPEPFCPPESVKSVMAGEDFMPTLVGDIYTVGVTLRLLVFGTSDEDWEGAQSLSADEEAVWSFIGNLTARDPSLRPTSASLLNDSFLAVVRIAQGVPVACRISSITVGAPVEPLTSGAYFMAKSNNGALVTLQEFINKKGVDFQVIRKGDSLTLYSTKNDPRQQDAKLARQNALARK